MVPIGYEEIVKAPKVLLHDHLDGGLRPATIVELAASVGHELPATEPEALARWFVEAADSGSLERYLETFAHTVAVMQTAESLRRVAAECAVDLAADGVVYAEVRFAPEQHLERGLTLDEVVQAVLDGFAEGTAEAARAGNPIRVGTLLTAMRHAARSREIAVGMLAVFSLLCLANLTAGLTHYGTTTGPILFGVGYVTRGEWWKVGFNVSVANMIIWLTAGFAWWKFLGFW